jgi:pimeloyl-ACP methyl ester carboxylesterase
VLTTRSLFIIIAVLAAAVAIPCVVVAGRAFHYAVLDDGGRAPPSPLLDHPESVGIPGLTNVEFSGSAGTLLRGWYVPAKNRAAVIVTSGTSANRLDMQQDVRILAEAGFGVLAFDWPGTGQSGGAVNWGRPAVAALEAAVDYLVQRVDVDPKRIGALGFSIGGIETSVVASSDPRLRAVILEGTPPQTATSVVSNSATQLLHHLPEVWAARLYGLPEGSVRPVELVGRIAPRAVFLIGGTRDIYANPQAMAQMCSATGEPKQCWVVPDAVHGGYADAAPSEYAARITGFFARELFENAH